jgi:aminopeptidase N
MMRSLTPQAVELLQRDPRFASKLGLDGFGLDKDHPDFSRLFNKVKEQQDKAAERRAKHDRAQFRVVSDLDDGAGDAGPSDQQPDEARQFVRETAAAAKTAAREARQQRLQEEKQRGASGKADDGVEMLEASQGKSNLGASERQRHEARRVQRHKKLTIAERMAKAGKK